MKDGRYVRNICHSNLTLNFCGVPYAAFSLQKIEDLLSVVHTPLKTVELAEIGHFKEESWSALPVDDSPLL